MGNLTNLAALANGPTRRQTIAGVAIAFGVLALRSAEAWASTEEISHSAESIHQEPVFKASRKRVYDALTETKQFDKIIELSGAMKSGMPPGANKATEISREEGARSRSSAGISLDGRSNSCRAFELSKPGGWAAGIRAFIRL